MKQPKCKICYDKGYASVLEGGTRIISDFGNVVEYKSGMEEVKKFCKCAKGKRLKRLALLEEK